MSQILEQYPEEVKTILAKYPPENKRSAVMPLLYLAQRAEGYIPLRAMKEIGELLEISVTDVASIVGFYTLYHDQPGGKYRIQVCLDLPCVLRGAGKFADDLCKALGIQLGETTPDGLITVERVTCLAGCHHAPLFQLQGDGEIIYHENQTVELAMALVKELRERAQKEVQYG